LSWILDIFYFILFSNYQFYSNVKNK
jgi:hypothetical protein